MDKLFEDSEIVQADAWLAQQKVREWRVASWLVVAGVLISGEAGYYFRQNMLNSAGAVLVVNLLVDVVTFVFTWQWVIRSIIQTKEGRTPGLLKAKEKLKRDLDGFSVTLQKHAGFPEPSRGGFDREWIYLRTIQEISAVAKLVLNRYTAFIVEFEAASKSVSYDQLPVMLRMTCCEAVKAKLTLANEFMTTFEELFVLRKLVEPGECERSLARVKGFGAQQRRRMAMEIDRA